MSAAGDLEQAAAKLEQFPEQAVRRAVDTLRGAASDRLKVDTGGNYRLSGVGNARLGIRSSVKGTQFVEGVVGAGSRRTETIERWLNDGTRPRTTSAGNTHPGTPAKRTWDDPIDRTLPIVERELGAMFDRII